MSQYRKHDLKLHVRSNREVDETVVLRWSAEIATQWSQYEYLRGKIDIPIGTTTGTLAITEENFAKFIDPGKGSKLENRIYFYFLIFFSSEYYCDTPPRRLYFLFINGFRSM